MSEIGGRTTYSRDGEPMPDDWFDASRYIFETMVFGGEHDQQLRRYCTEESAMRGHLETVDRLRAGRSPFDPDRVHDHCYGGDE